MIRRRQLTNLIIIASSVLSFTTIAAAQEEPSTPTDPSPEPVPADPTTPTIPSVPSSDPPIEESAPPSPRSAPPEIPEDKPMSEGRLLASLYNSGFQWGISPGVVFSRGKAGFAMGLHFGYGVDTGPVILVPGVRITGFFTDPSVYVGLPTFKVVIPIDRFAPFLEGGVGVGHVTSEPNIPAKTGLALMGGGGFMIYFRHFAFGAEASYQVITGTSFKGFGVGPILAIGF